MLPRCLSRLGPFSYKRSVCLSDTVRGERVKVIKSSCNVGELNKCCQAQQQRGTQTRTPTCIRKYTQTHVPKHNGLVQTVLLQDFHHNKTQL